MGTLCQSSKEIGLEKALACLDDALRMNPKDADSLISTYAFVLNKPSPIPKNSVPGQICELSEYKLDLSVYAALMGGK